MSEVEFVNRYGDIETLKIKGKSSAIEVLKGFLEAEQRKINHWDSSVRLSYDKEFVNALGVALLALEKQEKLEKWVKEQERKNRLEWGTTQVSDYLSLKELKKVLGGETK